MKKYLLATLVVLMLVAGASASVGWSPPRYGHTAVALPNGQIVLMSGLTNTGGTYLNDVWSTSDNGTTWTKINSSAGWAARSGACAVALETDGAIVLSLGTNAATKYDDFWNSTDNGTMWKLISQGGSYPNGRRSPACTLVDTDKIALTGGADLLGYTGMQNDSWYTAYGGDYWFETLDPSPWQDRYGHAMISLSDGSLVLMGGYDSDGAYRNDVWKSSNLGGTWVEMTHVAQWTPRAFHSAVAMSDDTIILMGGRNATAVNHDVWESVDDGIHWSLVTSNPGWGSRSDFPSVITSNDGILILGGYDGVQSVNDTWRSLDGGLNWQNRIESGLTNFTPQDIWMRQRFTQTFYVTDSSTGLSIPYVSMESGGVVAYTTQGTGYLDLDFGQNSVIFRATGYDAKEELYTVDSEGSYYVALDPTGAQQNTNIIYSQKHVRFRVVDMYSRTLTPVTISINYVASSLPSGQSNFLREAFGVSEKVALDMTNSSLYMVGVTGTDGSNSFPLFSSITYLITIRNETMGVNCSKLIAPIDTDYLLKCPTATQINESATPSLASILNRSYVWITEPNASYVTINAQYQDRTDKTSSVIFNVTCVDNDTVLYSHDFGDPGTAIVLDNYTMPNIRGMQIKSYLTYDRSE